MHHSKHKARISDFKYLPTAGMDRLEKRRWSAMGTWLYGSRKRNTIRPGCRT